MDFVESEYSKYNIDVKKLKRDYLKNPLKKIKSKTSRGLEWEIPCKEDLVYLYLLCGLSKEEMSRILLATSPTIRKWLNIYEIFKTKSQKMKEKTKKYIKTCQEKYGVENVFQLDGIKEKSKKTCSEKFGKDFFTKTEEYKKIFTDDYINKRRNRTKKTNLEKYGVENYSQTDEWYHKVKKTHTKKYGDWYSNTAECKKRVKETNLEKYGDWYPNTDECKKKIKKTNLEKYGFEKYTQTDEFKSKYTQEFNKLVYEKYKKTCKEKYGVENYSQTDEYKIKSNETQRRNNSFKQSNFEQYVYGKLIYKYGVVKRQYMSEKYPYKCDFYIPKLDLYIECQGYVGHGKEPYIGNEEQQKIVRMWLNKSKQINYKGLYKTKYLSFINIWTVRDPLKRKTAKDNNLNWVEFFNIEDFNKWFDKQ